MRKPAVVALCVMIGWIALPWRLSTAHQSEGSPLQAPGEALADAAGGRLLIADSGHNRIVVADRDTFEVTQIIGSGADGLQDGSPITARFFHPQGLALAGDTLYVADTDNNAIRAVDLVTGTIRTPASAANGQTMLDAPWDVAVSGGRLIISLSGSGQLWSLNLQTNVLEPYPLAEGGTMLVQPSGLAADDATVYSADSGANAVFGMTLPQTSPIKLILGSQTGEAGDRDGVGKAARLRHPLGVAVGPDGTLFVADTDNQKIRQVSLATGESKTLFVDASPPFNQPAGLSYADGKLYIADTGNDSVRVGDLATGQVTTVSFPNGDVLALATPDASQGEPVTLPSQTVAPGDTQLIVNLSVPQGYKVNDTAPFTLHLESTSGMTIIPADSDVEIVKPTMPIRVPLTVRAGTDTLIADVEIYYCEAVNETLCYVSRYHFTLPILITDGGAQAIQLDYTVTPPSTPNSTIKRAP